MKNVYIITEGGKNLGFGHIARCLSFYDKFSEYGYCVQLIVDGDESCGKLIAERNYSYVPWHSDIATLDFTRNNILFVDSLIATQEEVDYLQNLSPSFIIIDDYQRRHYNHALIIDWTPNVENNHKHDHNNNGTNVLLLGLDYSVLRETFIRPYERTFTDLHEVTVIMGGSDIRSLTSPIVDALLEEFMDIHINVVLGPASPPLALNNVRLSVFRSLNGEQIRNLFEKSDLVISAGGQTLLELAVLRTPTVPIQVIDNQTENLMGFNELGFYDDILQWNDPELISKIKSKIHSLQTSQDLRNYIGKFNRSCIGNGLNKIIDKIKLFCDESL